MTPQLIQSYYQESFEFLQDRKKRQVAQLVLLNNLQRGDQHIASTLLLTLFNRLLSNLYDDKIQVKFLPSQGINQEKLNAYNILAQSDYQEMAKAKLDYDWIWDTLFFGRGYMETLRFNKKQKILQPHVINPLVFGYDPFFENPQDWRYYWKWITKAKWEVKKLIDKKIITGLTLDQIPTGVDEDLWEYKIKRDQAKKAIEPSKEPINSDVYQILEFYGHDENGKKCVYWTDKNMAHILLKEELDLRDGQEIITPNGQSVELDSKWPIVVREAFREPHSSVVFSVADLLEDKHRAKSVLLNLAYIAAKDQANPLYWYDPNKIKDISQFFARQINQHIPVEGDGNLAVGPINKASTMSPELTTFISVLTQEANEPMGTGQVLQPIKGSPQTATERAIDQQLNDMAQSLQSKVLQFGESEFWCQWFARYKRYGTGTKIANIVGVKGIDSKEIDLSMFQTQFPPGVFIYSAKEAEYKETVLRRDLMELYPALIQTLDPDGMRNFNKHVFFPKFLQDPSLIDIMLPKTLDELKAEEENELLKANKMQQVLPTDNHTTHLYTHRMSQDKTWALWFHIANHEEELAKQKVQEQMMMQEEMQKVNKVEPSGSPREATAPLKKQMSTSNKNAKLRSPSPAGQE